MVLVMKFETENAIYNLELGDHDRTTETNLRMEQIDFIVLESGFVDYGLSYSDLSNHIQYKKIFEENNRQNPPKPVFLVDLPAKKYLRDKGEKGYYEDINNGILWELLCNIPLLFLPKLSSKLAYASIRNKNIAKINSYLNVLTDFYTQYGLRSAVSAEKIEHIAKKMKEENGKKPEAFIEYGALHSGMKHYIEKSWLRKAVIGFHKKMRKHLPCDENYLNLIKEFNFNGMPLNLGKVVSNHDYDRHKELIYKIS